MRRERWGAAREARSGHAHVQRRWLPAQRVHAAKDRHEEPCLEAVLDLAARKSFFTQLTVSHDAELRTCACEDGRGDLGHGASPARGKDAIMRVRTDKRYRAPIASARAPPAVRSMGAPLR